MVNKWKEIELRERLPMRNIIRAAYDKYGSQTAVAHALGVSQGTVSLWLVKCGLVERTIVVSREEEQESNHHQAATNAA